MLTPAVMLYKIMLIGTDYFVLSILRGEQWRINWAALEEIKKTKKIADDKTNELSQSVSSVLAESGLS